MKNLKLFKSGFCEKLKLLLIPIGLLIGSLTSQTWANETKVVGVTLPTNNTYTVKMNVQRDNWSADGGWTQPTLTKAGLTFEGKQLYVGSYETSNGWVKVFQFQTYDGNTQKYSKEMWNWNNNESNKANHFNKWVYDWDGGSSCSQYQTGSDNSIYNINTSKLYFDASGWEQTNIRVVVGHVSMQKYRDMSLVPGTQLYYNNNLDSWNDAMGFGIVGGENGETRIGDGREYGKWMTDISAHAYEYTGLRHYGLNNNGDNVCYLVVNNGKSGEYPDVYYNANYLTYLNNTQTYNTVVKAAGGSYTSANSKATINISSYELTSQGGTTARTPELSTSESSETVSACRTATTRLQVGTPATGYQFDGWYTDATGGSLISDRSDYTYYPTSANTYYARFSEKTFSVTFTSGEHGRVTTPSSSPQTVGQVTGLSINASADPGYYFSGWTVTSGTATFGNASSASTKVYPSEGATIKANFLPIWRIACSDDESDTDSKQITNITTSAGVMTSGYIDVTLAGNTEYNFKVFQKSTNAWWGNNTGEVVKITYDNQTYRTLSSEEGDDQTFRTAAPGTYRFTWDVANSRVTITYPTSYKVTYDANGGSGVAPTDANYYASGATVTVKGAGSLTKTGYAALAYWTAAEGGGTEYAITTGTFSITANKTLYAKWAQNITLNQNGADESGSTSLSATYKATLSTVGLETPKKIGYAFAGWATAASDGTVVINPDGTVNTVASWTDSDKKWIHNAASTLYAKWAEDNNTFTNAKKNGDWSDAGNWSAGVVPTNSYAAVQLSGELNVSSYIHVGSMDLTASGAKLTIQAGGTLEVAGAITNTDPDKLVIQTGNEGQGALIYDITKTAPYATVSMTTKNAAGSHYQYIASPVGGVSVADVFSGKGAYTYVWKEGAGWERRGYYDEIAAFEPIALKGKGSCSFVGQLYPGTTSLSLSYTATPKNAEAQGVNMLANALTAPIKIAAMTISGSLDGSVHVWNNGTWDHYAVASAGENVIPAMQVYAILASSSGSVSFDYTTAVRGASNKNAALKAPKRITSDIPEHLTISVRTNERDIDLQLYEDEMFTNEIDKGWEAIYMEGDGRFGELYALADEKMSILATPDLEGTILGFAPGETSDYTISFNGDGKGYYLNDMKELKSTLISEGNTYMFSPDESTNATRFVISRTPIHKVPTGTENVSAGTNARKQMINGVLYIIRDGRIYNAEGALVK